MSENRARLLVRRQDHRGEVGQLKSERSRRDIPLSPGMAERLWELGADRPATARVFTMDAGTPLNYSNLRSRLLVPVAKAAGLEWVTFHTFPPHLCVVALRRVTRRGQVAAWLGHTDPGFTLRTYVHLMDDGVGDATFLDAAVTVGSLAPDAAPLAA